MRLVISRLKPVFTRFRLLFASLFLEPPGHPVRRSLICAATWHMLIINWKVIVAHIYRTISDPSAHNEIRSPLGKIGPNRAMIGPPNPSTRPPLPLPIEPEVLSHPATHRASTRCLEAAPAPKALWGKGLPHKRGERRQASTCALSQPPLVKSSGSSSRRFLFTLQWNLRSPWNLQQSTWNALWGFCFCYDMTSLRGKMVSLCRVSPLKPQNCLSDSYFTVV